MKAEVKWIEEGHYMAETGSGHAIIIDGSPEVGGRNLGPRPMEMLLVGLGSCSSIDVVHILKKSRQDIRECRVTVDAKRGDTDPKVFTEIHLHYVVAGKDLDEKKVARAIELSATKYCSATAIMAKTATIDHDFEIVNE